MYVVCLLFGCRLAVVGGRTVVSIMGQTATVVLIPLYPSGLVCVCGFPWKESRVLLPVLDAMVTDSRNSPPGSGHLQ